MRESTVEKKLVDGVKKLGGKAFKWVSPGTAGVPDRIVIVPHGRIIFVEMKRPGEKPRPLQVAVINLLTKLGCDVRVLDNVEGVEKFLEELRNAIDR